MNRINLAFLAFPAVALLLSSCGEESGGTSAAADGPPPKVEGMVWIPAGKFMMGSDINGMPYEGPAHFVELDGFYIDKTEVTNAQFREFVTSVLSM